jgi:hypothetical protein
MTIELMLVPLNIPENEDLCMSIIVCSSDESFSYSVALMRMTNDWSMSEGLPSYHCFVNAAYDKFGIYSRGSWLETDYEVIKGDNLYDCIKRCLSQLEPLCITKIEDYIKSLSE